MPAKPMRLSSSRLPRGEKNNGAQYAAEEITADGTVARAFLVIADAPEYSHDVESGVDSPILTVRKIEYLGSVGELQRELPELQKVYAARFSRRTGQDPLPLDEYDESPGGSIGGDE